MRGRSWRGESPIRRGRPVSDWRSGTPARQGPRRGRPPRVTDGDGRFRLSRSYAPGNYRVVIAWKGITSSRRARTTRPHRSSRSAPADRKSGVARVFRREEWDRALLARVPRRRTSRALQFRRGDRAGKDPRRVRCAINGGGDRRREGYRLWDAALDANARLGSGARPGPLLDLRAFFPLSGAETSRRPRTERFTLATWWSASRSPSSGSGGEGPGRSVLSVPGYVKSGPWRVAGVFGKSRVRSAPLTVSPDGRSAASDVKRAVRRLVSALSAGVALFVLGSWLAARRLAPRLVSPVGLGPPPDRQRELLATLRGVAPIVEEFRHPGGSLDPVELAATFASPGDPARRPTILFLHGKGGRACEWEDSALLALALGYNVLLPDLRGHGSSGGRTPRSASSRRTTREPDRRGRRSGEWTPAASPSTPVRGVAVALELAGHLTEIRAVWLESRSPTRGRWRGTTSRSRPGISAALLSLTPGGRFRARVAQVSAELGLEQVARGWRRPTLVAALGRVRCPVGLVYGDADRLVPPLSSSAAGGWPPEARYSAAARGALPPPRRSREGRAGRIPAPVGRVLPRPPAGQCGRGAFRGSSVRPLSWPHAAAASGPRLRRTVTATPESDSVAANRSMTGSAGRFHPGR